MLWAILVISNIDRENAFVFFKQPKTPGISARAFFYDLIIHFTFIIF